MKAVEKDTSSQALEDYGNDRVQLKVDLIEKPTYLEILSIFKSFESQAI